MTQIIVFVVFWVSGAFFIEMLALPACSSSLLIFLGTINFIVANAVSNQCRY